jgi:hypothetical protein
LNSRVGLGFTLFGLWTVINEAINSNKIPMSLVSNSLLTIAGASTCTSFCATNPNRDLKFFAPITPTQLSHHLAPKNIPLVLCTCLHGLYSCYGLKQSVLQTIAAQFIVSIPFMAYDYYKYSIKYGIKTQTITEVIKNHKKQGRDAFCTLF